MLAHPFGWFCLVVTLALAACDAPPLEPAADRHLERGEWGAAMAAYRELIASEVDSARICVWQGNIVRASAGDGNLKAQVGELQRHGAVLARLEARLGVRAAEVVICRENLRRQLEEVALSAHKQAQKERDGKLFGLVDQLYRQYRMRFPDAPRAATMTFYHAEALWQLDRWDDAAATYRQVIEMDRTGPHTLESAYAVVLAHHNAAAEETPPAARRAGDGPVPFSAREQRLLQAFGFYLEVAGAAPEANLMRYRRARMYYEHNQWGAALPLLADLVARNPDGDLGVMAADLQLDVLQTLGRTSELTTTASALLASPLARDREAAARWRALVRTTRKGEPAGE